MSLATHPPERQLSFPEFVALLAMLFATIAFSIDAMLPALTAIAADLSPGAVNRAQLVVTVFVLGMGLGTLFWGPISDSYGRKRIVIFGIGLYAAAAMVAAQAQTLEVLLAARFVQGLGAAAPRVVTLAIVRDLYQGRPMARVMSIVMTIFIIVPAVAPSVGAAIIWVWDWRAVFWSFVIFGIVSGSWLMLRQPETHPPERRRPLRIATIAAAAVEVMRTPRVPAVIAALSLGFGQMFIFLSTSPQIFADVFDREASFPFWFAGVALVAGMSGILNASLVMRLGMRRLATTAFAAQAAVSVLFLVQ
jgi:DHA1 family bicyclomycin/chloramphenicol resistance-like MFS transporter